MSRKSSQKKDNIAKYKWLKVVFFEIDDLKAEIDKIKARLDKLENRNLNIGENEQSNKASKDGRKRRKTK